MAKVVLPLFLKEDRKIIVGWMVFLSAALLYLMSNHFHLTPPRYLPTTWIDENTPFIPWTIWFYVSEWVFFAYTYLVIKKVENTNKYLYSFFVMQLIAGIIFIIWPTTYPRHLYPLPTEGVDFLTLAVFNQIRGLDTPANCCPSLHVSTVYLLALIFLEEQREKFGFVMIWATLISLSTLTTKQHYLVDVVTGFIFALVCYWVFFKMITYRPVGEVTQKSGLQENL